MVNDILFRAEVIGTEIKVVYPSELVVGVES
jgi:hypothetical protein